MSTTIQDSLEDLLSSSILLFVGLVFELGFSFIAKLIIARALGPVDYGAVSLGLTTMMMVSAVVLLGSNTGVTRYLPRVDTPAEKLGVVIAAHKIVVPLAAGISLVLGLNAEFIATHILRTPSSAPVLQVIAVGIPFVALTKMAVGIERGFQSPKLKVLLNNLTLPIVRFAGIILVVAMGVGALGVAAAYVIPYIVATGIGYYFVTKKLPVLRGKPVPFSSRKFLRFSAPLMIASTMFMVFNDIDTLLIGYYLSADAIGIYNVVYPVSQLLTIFLTALSFLVMPIISEFHSDGDYGEMSRVYEVVTKWIFLTTFPLFMGLLLYPETVIKYTFGAEYLAGAVPLTLISAAFFTHAIAGPNASVLTAVGDSKKIMYANVTTALLNVVANLLLIPQFGIVGAAIATTGSYIALNAINSMFLYRETGIHPLTPTYTKLIVVSGLLLVVTHTLVTHVTLQRAVLLSVTAYAVYSILALRYGIEQEEIELVLEFEDRMGIDLGRAKQLVNRFIR